MRHALRGVLRDPQILLTSATQSAQFVLNGTLNAFLPLFALETLGFTASQLGWLFALQTATTLAARPLVGAIADRIDRRRVIVAGMALCSVGVWGVSLAARPLQLAVIVAAYALGVAMTTAAASAHISDLSGGSRFGTAHGLFGSIYDVGDAFGPIAAGLLVGALGYAPCFRSWPPSRR